MSPFFRAHCLSCDIIDMIQHLHSIIQYSRNCAHCIIHAFVTMTVRSIVLAPVLLLLLPQASSFGLLPVNVLWKQIQATTATIALAATLLGSPPMYSETVGTPGQDLQSTLAAPTQDRPQIQLPMNLQQRDKDSPILEALLYLGDPQVRPGPLDTIVITVRDAESGVPLAGAKLPVSKARFPVQLRLYKQNVLVQPPEAWDRAQDVTVRAVVCPCGTVIPCSENDITMRAEGISKLVRNLPGLPEKGVGVRAGAALRLVEMIVYY